MKQEYWNAAAIVLVALALVLIKLQAKMCTRCRSSDTREETESSIEWGTDVGGILKSDPYRFHKKFRVCGHCGDKTLVRTWATEIGTDETAAKNFEKEVMALDFTPREPRPPRA